MSGIREAVIIGSGPAGGIASPQVGRVRERPANDSS